MNFALTDEQIFMREAARGALSRFKTVEAARGALADLSALPDLWPTAVQAGWTGLLIYVPARPPAISSGTGPSSRGPA